MAESKPQDVGQQIRLQTKLLGSVREAIIATDLEGRIVYWNPFAEELYGWSAAEVVGQDIVELITPADARQHASEIMSALRLGKSWTGEFQVKRKDGTTFPALVTDSPILDESGTLIGIVGISHDLSEQKQAEEASARAYAELEAVVQERTTALRLLSTRLLHMQDDERRRIARELHDSIGQQLTALAINLDLLGHSDEQTRRQLLAECREAVSQGLAETRTLSHLLHPPLLDEAGFSSAAHWYVKGFAQRSEIPVKLNVAPNLPRLPNIELVLFRVLQETLTNVHRHAKASAIEVSVSMTPEDVRLDVIDNGSGMPPALVRRFRSSSTGVGVGLAGMQERVRDTGGTFEIESDALGTRVRVTIPLPRDVRTMANSVAPAHPDRKESAA